MELAEDYLRALEREASSAEDWGFGTLFVGGGTPSYLGPSRLARLFEILFKNFNLENLAEFSVELNPESTSRSLLEELRAWGVNRISVGVQSFWDEELRALGRVHSAREARRALGLALELGFSVNADLMFGFEGQTLKSFEGSLLEAVRLGVHHVSTYSFTPRKGPRALPEEDVVRMFYLRDEVLLPAGYERYEISNYALRGHRCLHNLNYWRGGEYLGLGPSAESFRAPWRWRNRGLWGYLKGLPPAREHLSPSQILAERVFLGIRLSEGLEWPWGVPEELEGLVVKERGRVRLTQRGVLVADSVALALVAQAEAQGAGRRDD